MTQLCKFQLVFVVPAVLIQFIQLTQLVMANAFDTRYTNQSHKIVEDCQIIIDHYHTITWNQWSYQNSQMLLLLQPGRANLMSNENNKHLLFKNSRQAALSDFDEWLAL